MAYVQQIWQCCQFYISQSGICLRNLFAYALKTKLGETDHLILNIDWLGKVISDDILTDSCLVSCQVFVEPELLGICSFSPQIYNNPVILNIFHFTQ